MNNSQLIVNLLNGLGANKPCGTFQFFGQWFGRPYDNVHVIVRSEHHENYLIVHFEYGEKLYVWDPEDYNVSSNTFTINIASKVRWEWYYYGRPALPENLCFYEYSYHSDLIDVSGNFKQSSFPSIQPPFDPAVKMW